MTLIDSLYRHLLGIFALPPMSAEERAQFRIAQTEGRDYIVVPAVLIGVLLVDSYIAWDLLRDAGRPGLAAYVRLGGGFVVLAALVLVRRVLRLSFRAQALCLYCAVYVWQAAIGWALGHDAPLQLPGLMVVMFCGVVVLPRAVDALVNVPLAALSVPLVLPVAHTTADVLYVVSHFVTAVVLVLAGTALVERMSAVSFGYRRRLQREASTDALTGLDNRREFEVAITREIERAKRMDVPLTLALVDIDHFKRVNDTWGHDAGDEILRQLAAMMRAGVRGSDLVARVGGEEFAFIMLGTSPPGAEVVLERLRVAIAAVPLKAGGATVDCTVSTGVTEWSSADADWHALYKRADAALYEAKQGGRNRVVRAR